MIILSCFSKSSSPRNVKMLIKVLPILHIIATYYYIECLEPKEPQKKLEQISPAYEVDYGFDSMIIESTPNPSVHTAAELIAIQYAPIEITDNNNHKHTYAPKRTEPPTTEYKENKPQELGEKDYLQPVWSTVQMIDRQQNAPSFFSGHDISVLQSSSNIENHGEHEYKEHKPQELEEKDYLQPEWSTVQMVDRQQKARSFFSRPDISVLQSSSNVGNHGHHDLYRTYHNHVDQSKIRNAVYSSFQNPRYGTPEEELMPDGRTVLYLPGSGHVMPLQEKKYVRKVVPFVLTKPFLQGAYSRAQIALQKPSGRNKLPKTSTEKPPPVVMQLISALSPGLQLNLARVYGIAHTDDHRHIDVPHRREKPPIMNKKTVDKKKRILHPFS